MGKSSGPGSAIVASPFSNRSLLDRRTVQDRHDQHHNEDKAEKSGWTVAPAAAMWPSWNSANDKKDENNKKNGGHE
jgi:hypothetical protein